MVISHEVYWELSKETSGKTHERSDFECFTSLTYSYNNLLVGPSEIEHIIFFLLGFACYFCIEKEDLQSTSHSVQRTLCRLGGGSSWRTV